MAAPTVYKWSDVGAPQVKRGNEADYLALFQAVTHDYLDPLLETL